MRAFASLAHQFRPPMKPWVAVGIDTPIVYVCARAVPLITVAAMIASSFFIRVLLLCSARFGVADRHVVAVVSWSCQVTSGSAVAVALQEDGQNDDQPLNCSVQVLADDGSQVEYVADGAEQNGSGDSAPDVARAALQGSSADDDGGDR